MKPIAIITVGLAFLYLLCAFVAASFDITDWNPFGRLCAALAAAGFVCCITIMSKEGAFDD